ncbi:MAG: S8 family serine peptidase [Actinobacteria bacterium]|nr:S8 family serine peptidase [Actinomycetota bacterium]
MGVTCRAAVVGQLAAALMLSMTSTALAASPSDASRREDVIVVFHDTVRDPRGAARDMARRHDGEVRFVYEHALKGFAGRLPAEAIRGMQSDRRVDFVELDQRIGIFNQAIPTGVRRIFADENANIGIDGSNADAVNVDVAIIDTGIDDDRPDELNVVGGARCTSLVGLFPSCSGGGYDDDNGHGTHVAGTVGAIDDNDGVVGVAPGARLWAVKVLTANGTGWMSQVAAGVDWVTARAKTIEVANMSLGCECSSSALDRAISGSVAKGVVYAVAAGNDDADANDFSPANHKDVITVSALADFDGEPGHVGASTCRKDQDDTLADFSNWGTTVEVAAPGVCILSTVPRELDTSGAPADGYATYSGTSMASPHVAGAAALLASRNNPNSASDVQLIRDTILSAGNFDWIDDSGDGVMEPLLDVGVSTVFDPILTGENSPSSADSN